MSCGRKDISIIGCGLMNAVCNFQQSFIILGTIRWWLVYVRERKTGLGLSIHTGSKVDRLVLKTMGFDSPKAQKSGCMNSRCNNVLRTTGSIWKQAGGRRYLATEPHSLANALRTTRSTLATQRL